ncbi:MAG: hypothetical protein EPN84_07705 [Legionella sp.]|nr:MAG: hypothetical protein EPN84_07705 [Legionella sp.]
METKLEITPQDKEKIRLVYTQIQLFAKEFEKELQGAAFIDNGPAVTVKIEERPETVLMLRSFFSSNHNLIPAGMQLDIDVDPSLTY